MSKKNDKPTILVLGSSPSAVIKKYDYIYAANAAAGYYKEELNKKRNTNIISLVSAAELDFENRKMPVEKKKWLATKRKLLVHANNKEIIVYGVNIYKGAATAIPENPKKYKISHLSSHEVWDLIRSVTGRTCPMLTLGHFICAKHSWIDVLKIYVKDILIKKICVDNDMSGLFRPSTGLVALLIAISKHGKNAQYVITGITFRGRGVYPDKTVNSWTKKNKLLDFHVIVDKYILSKLKKKYNLTLINDIS